MCRPLSDAKPRRCNGKCNDPAHRAAYQKAGRARHRAEDNAEKHVSPPESDGAPPPEPISLSELIDSLNRVLAPDESGSEAEQAQAAMREAAAEERLLEEYGSLDQAAIAIGARIASRAEELAGITEQEVVDRYQARVVRAEAAVKAAEPAGPVMVKLAQVGLSKLRHGHHDDTQKDLRRLADGYQAALAEHREFGGILKLHDKSNGSAKKAFQEIAELFPADWLAASNNHRVLLATSTVVRAHYADSTFRKGAEQRVEANVLTPEREAQIDEPDPAGQWVKTGRMGSSGKYNAAGVWESHALPVYERPMYEVLEPGDPFRAKKDGTPHGGYEKWVHPENGTVYWRKPVERKTLKKDAGETVSQIVVSANTPVIEGRSATFETAAHEFSHRAEASVAGVKTLKGEFLLRRTSTVEDPEMPGTLQREELVRIYAGKSEYARPDHFVSTYIGKDYPQGYTEILSMGMESLFAGSNGGLIGVNAHKADPEMKHFILGTLVTAGHRN